MSQPEQEQQTGNPSSAASASVTNAPSQAATINSDDPAWAHCFCPNINKKHHVQCKYCKKLCTGGITRIKYHLAAGTKASTDITVPSVQMLAIQVKLGTHIKAMMLPSFLRCFPNTETLYIQSENDGIMSRGPLSSISGNGELDLKFWEEADPIECVQRHIKKLVLREFRGMRSELDFLKFIAERAQVLENMVVEMAHGISPSGHVGAKLKTYMASAKWANGCCKLNVSESPFWEGKGTPWCYLRAFDRSILDPFNASKCAQGKCLSN